jgi:hypothetical protein
MKSVLNNDFRVLYSKLPSNIKELAIKTYKIWKVNHFHPGLHYKKFGNLRSVRIGDHYRALARVEDDAVVWFWIGSHEEYNGF